MDFTSTKQEEDETSPAKFKSIIVARTSNKPSKRSREDFAKDVMDNIVPRLEGLACESMQIFLTDTPNPPLNPIPFRKRHVLIVAVTGETVAVDRIVSMLKLVADEDGDVFGYRVKEMIPLAPPTFEVRKRHPGPIMLTFLAQSSKLSYDEFMREWHDDFSPTVVETQPLQGYIKNVIPQTKHHLVPNPPEFRGIVEEYYGSNHDFNPTVLFGKKKNFLVGMVQTAMSSMKLIDPTRTEVYFAHTYVLKR